MHTSIIRRSRVINSGIGGMSPFSPPPTPLTFTPTATAVAWQVGPTSPTLFTSTNIGTPSADRIVVVVANADASTANGVVTGVVINGVNATLAVGVPPANGTTPSTYIWYALVTAGSSVTIEVDTAGAFPSGVGIAVGTITGSATATISATNTVAGAATADPHSITAVVPANGVAVVGVATDRLITATWTSATGDASTHEVGANGFGLLMAHGTANSPSFTGANGFGVGMAMATFKP